MAIFKAQNTLLDGLLSYYTFNADANDDWTDNDATSIVGASNSSGGLLDNCYYFDGVDDYIELTDSDGLWDYPSRSISFWFKTPDFSFSDDLGAIIMQSSVDLNYGGYSIYWNSTDFKINVFRDQDSVVLSRSSVSANEWHHIAVVGTFGTISKYYLDGNLIKISKGPHLSGGSVSYKNTNIVIGADRRVTRRHAKMYFDEMGFWKRELSEGEVSELYNSGSGKSLNKMSYTPRYARKDLKENLIAYWKFEEASGDLIDYIGNNDGTNNNVTYEQDGVINKCYRYDKTLSGYTELSRYPTIITNNNNYTHSFWIYFYDVQTEKQIFEHSNNVSDRSALYLKEGTIRFGHYTGSSYNQVSGPVTTGKWYHIACVHDGATSNKLYIDGVQQNGTDHSGSNGGSNFRIGTNNTSTPTFFMDVLFDEYAIWDSALDSESVKILYNNGDARPLSVLQQAPKKLAYGLMTNLVSYWSFDENANDNHRDDNGSVNGATLMKGFYNSGYYFDGLDDEIDMAKDAFEFSPGTHLTVNLWVNTTNPTSGDVLAAWAAVGADQYESGFGLYNDNKWYMGNGATWTSIDAGVLDDGSWHMYSLVYNGSAMTSYRDGEQVAVSGGSFVANYLIDQRLRIGNDNRNLSGREFNGYIDETGIWDRSLTEKEIKLLYNEGQGIKYTNFKY